MADSIDRIMPPTAERDAPTPYESGGNGHPGDPEAMREEIERTRARMSRTLDELETRIIQEREALERKRVDLWEKATLKGVRRKLSTEPWRSMGIAFAVGYILASIRE